MIDELRSSARPLIATCDPEVVRRIAETIHSAECTWTETNDNLRDLRDRYERAVDLWSRYRDCSDVIRHWADDQMNGIGRVQPLDVADIEVSVNQTPKFTLLCALFAFRRGSSAVCVSD